MIDATLDLTKNELPECTKALLVIGNAVITFWYDEDKYVKAYHSTDWDNAGWNVIKQKALEWGLRWAGDDR